MEYDELHVAPVERLVMYELERRLAQRAPDDKVVTRISSDYLGVLGFDDAR